MTAYELIRALAQFSPDREVMVGIIPKGNRKIKRDLRIVGVADWGWSAEGQPEPLATITVRKEVSDA